MPRRKTIFVNNQFYHIYNRIVEKKEVFLQKRIVERAILTLNYYQYKNPVIKLSYFLSQSKQNQKLILNNLKQKNEKLVDIIAYCFMPNHYHLQVKQLITNGISTFISKFQNSFTKYFNTLNKRIGHLFEGPFKAKIILSEEEFIHINRYIHLNPYTSFLVKDINNLKNYSWSSILEYLNKQRGGFCNKEIIFSYFKTKKRYWKFLADQADYQRKLNQIKNLLLE